MFVSALMEDGIPEVVSQPPAAVRLDVPDAWVTVVARLPHPTDIFPSNLSSYGKDCTTTLQSVPRWSPIQVLTRANVASRR